MAWLINGEVYGFVIGIPETAETVTETLISHSASFEVSAHASPLTPPLNTNSTQYRVNCLQTSNCLSHMCLPRRFVVRFTMKQYYDPVDWSRGQGK